MRVYLDNAATTSLDSRVLDAMLPFLQNNYGNPSSIHSHGREVRAAIERARKTIAKLINAAPSEIFFTSGGTEANNFALQSTIESLKISHAITSPLEHHAVLHPLERLEKEGKIKLSLLKVDSKGFLDYEHLENLLKENPKTIVSLMHINNEIGHINDIHRIGELCKTYGAMYHCDTVQSLGHMRMDVQELPLDFLIGAAHKFHGPKGVGFIYIRSHGGISPLIQGGAQERNMRGGTENVYGIVGMAKALEIVYEEMDKNHEYIVNLKRYMRDELKRRIPDVSFNGNSDDCENSACTILNVCFPPADFSDMVLLNLDIQNISASGGSACTSGAKGGSHVLTSLGIDPGRASIRFSFGRENTQEEIDYVIQVLEDLYKGVAVAN